MRQNNNEKFIEADEPEKPARLPLEARNPFQMKVFEILIADGRLNEEDMDKVKKISADISGYIDVDKPESAVVRDLIEHNKFKEAAEIMAAELEREEDRQKAA